MKKLSMSINSSTLTLSDGLITLDDTGLTREYNTLKNSYSNGNKCVYFFNGQINSANPNVNFVGSGEICVESEDSRNIEYTKFTIALWDDYVIDEKGNEWEMQIEKTFIKK